MEPGSLWIYILLLLILILTNAFFAMSEIAIISLNDNKIRKMANEGNKTAIILVNMLKEPSKFLATIQVGVTLSGLLASAVAADTFTEYIVDFFRRYSTISPTVVRVASLAIITLLLSFFSLVFGELVPKRIGMQNFEKISFAVAKPLSTLYKLEKPFVWLLSHSTNGVLRLLGINPDQKSEEVTEEEIRMMVDVGNESGTIEQSEKDMINNIFEFNDLTAGEIMTHRTEITAIDFDTDISEIIAVAVEDGHSRIPVYNESLDDIQGILYVKDLLKLITENKTENFDVSQYMRKALYVPESNRAKELFQEFKQKKVQMAIVVDEYGGTSGLVTMEDLLESIVGNMQDEYDDEDEEISQISENVFIIDGVTSLYDIKKLFNIDFSDDEDYDTIAGYITDFLGHIPSEDEHPVVVISDIEFTVMSMDERRISKIRAERIIKEETESSEDEK
jgi:putative hemolysin